jgi:predicted nucleotidyltransferase
MKESKYKPELIAYASAFVSFIFPKIEDIKEIILFGSTARGEADKESDIDLFFYTEKKHEEKIKAVIKEELKKFYKSKIAQIWALKGINNLISANVGELEEWELKRSIISDGILLYSKYKEVPEKMGDFIFFNIVPIKNIAKRNKITREIFGRKEKVYSKKGILEEYNGKKISPTSFIIQKTNASKIIDLLGKEKIDYTFFEFWTDEITLKNKKETLID